MNLGSIPDPWGPQELRVWQVEAELCIFNLNSCIVCTGISLPAPKQLCGLAHLGIPAKRVLPSHILLSIGHVLEVRFLES